MKEKKKFCFININNIKSKKKTDHILEEQTPENEQSFEVIKSKHLKDKIGKNKNCIYFN